MTLNAQQKIKLVLERILEEYNLGAKNSFDVKVPRYDLTYDSKIEDRNIETIFEHLKERGLLLDWLAGDEELIIFIQDNFGENATSYLKILTEEKEESGNSSSNQLELVVEDGDLYVLHKKGRTKIGRTDTRQAKLLRFMTQKGQLGHFYALDNIAEAIRKKTDTWDAFTDKRAVVETTLKEIQSKLSRTPIKLTFDVRGNAFSLTYQKSG